MTNTGGKGIEQVDKLLEQLRQNLDDATLSLKQLETVLGNIKVLGRDPSNAGPIFEKEAISMLAHYGLDDPESFPASREALRCLANAFLLNEYSRQIFVDLGYPSKVAERLKSEDRDDEFLTSRILFLMTYKTTLKIDHLVKEHQLAESINNHLAHHAKRYNKSARRESSAPAPNEEMAMVETLKLMFNITYYSPGLASKFVKAIEHLIGMLIDIELPSPPLQSPVTFVLNALLNLDLKGADVKIPLGRTATTNPLFPYAKPEQVINRLVSILNKAISEHPERDLDQAAAPLVTLIRRIFELAHSQIRSWMRRMLLPTEESRSRPLGEGDALASRLLRLSTSPMLPTLRENISSLLFELSDKDANKFVRNVGYGFASGFLMSHNIEVPQNAIYASAVRGSSDSAPGYNPVTGQRWSDEEKERPNGPEMTQEEKEREAERLFVLFERLKATGIVDVKNPVQTAIDDGRFEELDD